MSDSIKAKAPNLPIEDLMVKKVFRVTPDMKLWEVAEMFIRHHISGAPIVDASDHVISIIGEGAALRLAATEGLEATVAHCLPKLPKFKTMITLPRHADFTEAYRLFIKHNIHRIPIVDSNGLLHGIISRSTILKMFVEAHYGKKITRA